MPKIPGGYYLKARKIQESKIAHVPPHIREIWDWLLKEANHKDKKYCGFIVKRGQLFRTYKEIRDGLHWMVGYRKKTYSEDQAKKAMKFLRDNLMITTAKALGGVLITIINYNTYQNPKNYEGTNESTNESTNAAPMPHQYTPANNKNDKNDKNKDKKKYIKKKLFNPPTIEDVILYCEEKGFDAVLANRAFEHYNIADWHDAHGKKVKNWKQKINTNWLKPENKRKPNKNGADAFAV